METTIKELQEKYEEEKCLKNEAYAFILANGLLDKFTDYQNSTLYRNKQENVISYLVTNAEPDGEWITG